MRIGIDAVGGDHAPREVIRGVQWGLRFIGPQDEIVLYGPEDVVQTQCREFELSDPRVRLEHCSQVIEMTDSPVDALRQKRDSSIVRMANAAAKREVDAVISAGHTGAFAAACQLKIGVIKGCSRPGIAIIMPTFHGPVVICDVGANVSPKPHHLYEYAWMASIYSKRILGIQRPRVGLASIGEEDAKGNLLVKEANGLMKADERLNFVGNMEGKDIFAGHCDVFVCDGFVGNIVLKLTEGLAEGLFKTVIAEIKEECNDLLPRFEPIVNKIWKKHDFAEYGGAPLLGIDSVAIICHGRSDYRAIGNAIRVAMEQLRTDLRGMFATELAAHREDAA